MTKEDEIPDWVGAQEFYDKYEPKEILGRWDRDVFQTRSAKTQLTLITSEGLVESRWCVQGLPVMFKLLRNAH